MKETIKTSRTAGYLEKIFRALNVNYFDGELEEPIITIQSTPRAYGHVTAGKAWHRTDGEERHELNLGAGTLDRLIENVVATVLHEMVHLFCIKNDIKDTSRGGTYHNKRFKGEAEKRDLHIEYDSRIGWSITEPTENLINFIIEQGWADIRMGRTEGLMFRGPGAGNKSGGGTDGVEPKKTSTRKYACPKCRQSIRATKTVNIICGDCMEKMVVV